ncbi:MAG TPA: ComEC/Rec2 family competence protein [Aeromicrobium sp.]|nr:ComEC/Rec2 family competence protein [Aeromicrobium sp.]
MRDLAERRAVVAVDAVVATDPRNFSRFGGESSVIRLDVRRLTVAEPPGEGRTWSGRFPMVAFVRDAGADLSVGRRVLTHGRLQVSTESDVVALLHVDRRSRAQPGAWWWTAADRVRAGVRHAVRHASPDSRALVPALVDGDDAHLRQPVRDEFRRAGLTHLLAVSGTNLTIVLMLALTVARASGLGRRRLLVVGFLSVVGFVLLARPDPSVVRAAAMGSAGLVAVAVGGRGGVRALVTAVVVLLFLDPWLGRSPGFVLSVCATAGILLAANPLAARFSRWMPNWCALALAVPLAAQWACLPAVVALSGEVSMVGIAANVVAAPLVAPATIAGLVGGLLDVVHGGIAQVPGTLAAWSAGGILAIAHQAAGLGGAAVPWHAPWWALLGILPFVGYGLWRVADQPMVVAGLALGLSVGLVRPPQFGWPPDGWVMVACDVGQGDATVLRAGPRSAVLVDAGPDPLTVDGCLRRLRINHVPLVVITHAHADHLAGWPGAFRGRKVGRALRGPSGGPGTAVVAGDQFRVGPLLVDVVWPSVQAAGAGEPDASDGTAMNNASVVLRVTARGVSMLLSGDVEPEAQEAILTSGAPIDANVLKFPHHGSGEQSPEFLRAVGAQIATISVGKGNDYGHPDPEALDLLRQGGTAWRRTDVHGDIAIVLQDGRVRVVTRR